MPKKKILITNDDGIYGPGLKPLEKEMSKVGQVFTIVSDQERSATSHSLTLHKPLRVHRISRQNYILSGTPADCARFGILHLLKGKADLVVSGINSGVNLGEDVIYSGTIAAAIEATLLEVPAMAVSRPAGNDSKDFIPAAKIAARLGRIVLKYGLPRGVCLNINVPSPKKTDGLKNKGFQITRLGHRLYGKKVTMRSDPRGRHYYWLLTRNVLGVPVPGTDIEAFERGHTVITPLGIDWTAEHYLPELEKWRI